MRGLSFHESLSALACDPASFLGPFLLWIMPRDVCVDCMVLSLV